MLNHSDMMTNRTQTIISWFILLLAKQNDYSIKVFDAFNRTKTR